PVAFPGLQFVQPIGLTFAPGDPNRLYVIEKRGKIWAVRLGPAPSASLFLDLENQVYQESECGLLGLAFHPEYFGNGRFFVVYTTWLPEASPPGIYQRLSEFRGEPG